MSGFNDGFKGFDFVFQVFDTVGGYEVFKVMVFVFYGVDYFKFYSVLFFLFL